MMSRGVKNRSAGPPTCQEVCLDIGHVAQHPRGELGAEPMRAHAAM